MSRLPLVTAKELEKVLKSLGFDVVVRKEVMFFIGIRIIGILLYRIIKDVN